MVEGKVEVENENWCQHLDVWGIVFSTKKFIIRLRYE